MIAENVKFDPSTLQVIKHSDPSSTPMDQSAQKYIKGGSSLFGHFTGYEVL